MGKERGLILLCSLYIVQFIKLLKGGAFGGTSQGVTDLTFLPLLAMPNFVLTPTLKQCSLIFTLFIPGLRRKLVLDNWDLALHSNLLFINSSQQLKALENAIKTLQTKTKKKPFVTKHISCGKHLRTFPSHCLFPILEKQNFSTPKVSSNKGEKLLWFKWCCAHSRESSRISDRRKSKFSDTDHPC